jgi:hypothetical protein
MRGGRIAAAELFEKTPDDDAAMRPAAAMHIARIDEIEGYEICAFPDLRAPLSHHIACGFARLPAKRLITNRSFSCRS